MDRTSVTEAVHAAIDHFNTLPPPCDGLQKSPATVLLGPESRLDSLGLVSLLVAVERELAERFAVELTLADESALAEEKSPFRTVGSLVDYVLARLEERSRA
jgi:acyl carrier protein